MSAFENCTSVTPECPVSATLYAYYPDLAGNTLLLTVFAICSVVQLCLGIWKRLPAFCSVVSIGCILETLGYGGRVIMHGNPWSDSGFKLQIVCLILAPSFLAAGVYLTLKHVVLVFGPEHSRLRPHLYTWIFISCDFFSIVLQAVGGGIAASSDPSIIDIGSSVIVAGIAFQVATMGVCILLAIDFAFTLFRTHRRSPIDVGTHAGPRRFYFYLAATSIAFVSIFVRCIYRLPEMAGGWGNPLMRNEKEFLILDGAMIAIAAILMSVAHPGIFFPEIRSKNLERAQRSNSLDFAEVLEKDGHA